MKVIEGYSPEAVAKGLQLLKEGHGVGFTDQRTFKEVNELYINNYGDSSRVTSDYTSGLGNIQST